MTQTGRSCCCQFPNLICISCLICSQLNIRVVTGSRGCHHQIGIIGRADHIAAGNLLKQPSLRAVSTVRPCANIATVFRSRGSIDVHSTTRCTGRRDRIPARTGIGQLELLTAGKVSFVGIYVRVVFAARTINIQIIAAFQIDDIVVDAGLKTVSCSACVVGRRRGVLHTERIYGAELCVAVPTASGIDRFVIHRAVVGITCQISAGIGAAAYDNMDIGATIGLLGAVIEDGGTWLYFATVFSGGDTAVTGHGQFYQIAVPAILELPHKSGTSSGRDIAPTGLQALAGELSTKPFAVIPATLRVSKSLVCAIDIRGGSGQAHRAEQRDRHHDYEKHRYCTFFHYGSSFRYSMYLGGGAIKA